MRSLKLFAGDRPTLAPARGQKPLPSAVRRGKAGRGRRGSGLASHPWGRRGLYALAAMIGAGAVALGLRALAVSGVYADTVAGIEQGIATTMARTGLVVREVLVRGREQTPRDELLAAVGLRRGDPILFFEADEARRRIEQIAWVRAATVQRILPDTIMVTIEERRPYARWQVEGRTHLVDRDGKILTGGNAEDFRDLRRVVGEGAGPRARHLFEMLALEPELDRRVANAVRVRDRRWDIEFDNGVIAQLPEEAPDIAWRHLALLQREKKALDRAVVLIDLRLPDRTVMRLTPEAVEKLREQDKPAKKQGRAT